MPKPRKRHSVRRSHGALVSMTLMAFCFVVALLCVAVLWCRALPMIGTATVQFAGGDQRDGSMPLSFESGPTPRPFTVRTSLYTSLPIVSRLYRLVPDDCLDSLVINEKPVSVSTIRTCDYAGGIVVDLGDFIHQGENSVVAHITDGGGAAGFSFAVHPADPLLLSIAIFGLLISLWFVRQILMLAGRRKLSEQWMPALLTVGSWLRVWYALNTNYHVRAHDVDGHIDYVRYIVQHAQLPPVHGGWQFYQPPIYYLLNAVPSAIAMSLGLPDTVAMQAVSVVLSLISLFAFAAILKLLWPNERSLPEKCAALALFVAFPGIVFFSGRINNDALVLPLILLSLFFLLHRKSKSAWHWYAAVVVFALAVLTKTNALLLGPVLAVGLFSHPSWTRTKKWIRGVLGLVVFLAAISWFFVPRYFAEQSGRSMIVGNVGALNGDLGLKNGFSHLTTFRPGEIITHPFNSPWSDDARRQYFWEYYFRSAFFGEFGFSPLLLFVAQGLLAVWLLLLPWSLLGIARWIEKPHTADAVLFTALLSFMLGHLVFRMEFPFSSSQDFRYSAAVALPFLWYLLSSRALLPRWARKLLFCLVWLCCLVELAFVFGVLLT